MSNRIHIFYKTTYLKTGQYYYGSHYGKLNDSYRGSNKIIKSVQKKYGNTYLIRENLKIFNTKEDCFNFEDRFLKLYNLANDQNCLNMKNSAQGGDTWSTMSESDKIARKQKLSNKVSGKNNGNYGKPMPLNRKEKMIQSKIGKPIHTDDFKKSMSIRVKDEWENGLRTNHLLNYTNNRLGKSNSKSTNLKISNGIKSSEKYKNSRIKVSQNRINEMNLKLIEVKTLILNGYADSYILNLYNIKPITLYSWKRKIKERNI